MKILITGAGGMVGRNLIAHPLAADHEIHGPPRGVLDLTDARACAAYVADLRPDLLIHCASVVGGIQANIDGAARFLKDNLAIGLSVMAAAHAAEVPRVVNLASSCIYPAGQETPITEDQLLSGRLEPTNEGYAVAKLATWKLAVALGRDLPGARWRTLVPPNLFGAFDHFDARRSHLMAAAILKIDTAVREGAESVEIWGDGRARREFLLAADLADFIWRFCERLGDLPETMNVGVGTDHTIDDYYSLIAQEMGFTGVFMHDLERPVGVRRKLLDVTAQTRLGWAPPTSLAEGIAQAVHYFRQAPGPYSRTNLSAGRG